MSTTLTIEDFRPLLNTSFRITFDAQNKYDVELVEINEGSKITSLNLIPFTLRFKGDANEKIFAQGHFNIHSEVLGDQVLFLIPRTPDDSGIYYDAIFG